MARSDIILATHNPQTLRQYCDRGAVLADGALSLYDNIGAALGRYHRACCMGKADERCRRRPRRSQPRRPASTGCRRPCTTLPSWHWRVRPALPVRSAGGGLAVSHGRRVRPLEWGYRPRAPSVPRHGHVCADRGAAGGARRGSIFSVIAADQYVAEFRFGLRSAEPVRADPGQLLSGRRGAVCKSGWIPMSSSNISPAGRSSTISTETLDLRRMFSSLQGRLAGAAAICRRRSRSWSRYWRGQVDAFFDPTNGTIVVKARAFTPQDALDWRKGSSPLPSGWSTICRRGRAATRCAMPKTTCGRAEQRLDASARQAARVSRQGRNYRSAQDRRRELQRSTGRVRDELVRADTELSTLKDYMQGDAPTLKLLEARDPRARSATARGRERGHRHRRRRARKLLSRVMGSYEQLESERSFAESAYRHALEALDRARMNADRQHVYIADFVQPRLPEEALYPRRLRSLGIVFLIAFAIWAIGCLTVRSVRDHLRIALDTITAVNGPAAISAGPSVGERNHGDGRVRSTPRVRIVPPRVLSCCCA